MYPWPVIEPRYSPLLWYVSLHYHLLNVHRFHTCSSHLDILPFRSRFWIHRQCSCSVGNTNDANSRFRIWVWLNYSVEPFLVTVRLQRYLWSNQGLPCVTTQRGGAVVAVSNQREKGVGVLGNDNKLNLMAYPHPQTDLGEGCIPVGRQFGFLLVKPRFPCRL